MEGINTKEYFEDDDVEEDEDDDDDDHRLSTLIVATEMIQCIRCQIRQKLNSLGFG